MIQVTSEKDINIHLGYGDVIVTAMGSSNDDDAFSGVRFNQAKGKHEIGEPIRSLNVLEDDETIFLHPSINLLFHDKNSIDVIIEKLLFAKELMIKKEKENEIGSIQ